MFEHEEISDLIAEQLNLREEAITEKAEHCDIEITEEEIDYRIRTSPMNIATGIERISYQMIRYWRRNNREGC